MSELWPQVLNAQHANGDADAAHCELQLLVPSELVYFQGHFPDAPVLPGVVQLHWALHYARLHLGLQGDFERVSALKFQTMIEPDTMVTLRLHQREPNCVQFTYLLNDEQTCGSGRLWMQPHAS